MITVDKSAYWDRLVDHYYDHVWCLADAPPSINDWLHDDYNCDCSYYRNTLTFRNPRDYTMFALRFSQ